jgi:hypothetical protein
MLMIPNCLDIQLKDSGRIDSPTHRPRSTLQKHYFSACRTLGLVRPERLGKVKKIIYLIVSSYELNIVVIKSTEVFEVFFSRMPF